MLKQLVIISGILIMSGCTSISERGHCDPNLNYVKSNIPAMKEYSQLKKEGKIDSIYFRYAGELGCEDDQCLNFNQDAYNFLEMNFDSKNRKGIYKITAQKDFNSPDCVKSIRKGNCLIAKKVNTIESEYELFFDATAKENIKVSFRKIKENKILYEKSYQVYSTGGLGGPGGAFCSPSSIENKNYNFDAINFPDTGAITNNGDM